MPNPYLPQEILDSIVDLLRDNSNALKECCLVSKTWIPRTRKHLFAEITFNTERDLISWKKFPDPSTSPAHYTDTLHVGCLYAATPAGGWIRGFSRVVNLKLDASNLNPYADDLETFLAPFHGISPTTKSLRVYFAVLPPSRVLNLILSLPFLEDLTLAGDLSNTDGPDWPSTTIQPSNLPTLTGSLEFHPGVGIRSIAHRLLSLPGGIHPRNPTLTVCNEEDRLLVVALLEECSYTLESLDICYELICTSIWSPHPHQQLTWIELSFDRPLKVTRLKDVTFRITGSNDAECVIMALRTITPVHQALRQISIHETYYSLYAGLGAEVKSLMGEQTASLWSELDQLLVQLWKSHSIRPRMRYDASPVSKEAMRDLVWYYLPEITRRGIVDLVKI